MAWGMALLPREAINHSHALLSFNARNPDDAGAGYVDDLSYRRAFISFGRFAMMTVFWVVQGSGSGGGRGLNWI